MTGLDDDIIRNALLIAAEESAITVVKAAHSQFIVEGSDAGIAILTRGGELVAQAAATSMLHSGGMVEQLRAIVEDHPLESMLDGDVFIVNDSYRGGVHANDVMLARPVFVAGTLEFFTAALIHVLDLGGAAHGGINARAMEVLEEGLQLPPLHLARAGVRNEDLVKLLRLNSRAPDETLGDIDALAAGTLVCARRLQALADEFGVARLHDTIARYLDHTEAFTRTAIRMLPDGVYRGRSTLDDDGINVGRAYEIAVEVAIEGDSVSLDFSGTSPQVRASINSSASQAFDAAIFALRLFLDKDIPSNSGLFRPITANFPRGSLLNPDPPHPCGGRMMAVYAVADALIQALSAATPQQRLAQSGMLLGYTIAGVAGPYWIHNAFDFGGVGAALGRDGIDGEGFHFGVGRNQIPQIEPVEAGCPILVESVEVIADSGGAGRWRGGLGVRVTHRLLADAVLSLRTDHVRYPPQGIDGGGAARPGGCTVVTSDGITTSLPTKIANVPVSAGSQFIVETSGGGGVGAANERDLEAVMIDVVEGKVTRDAARTVYGVVFDESGRPDPVATREYRRACD